MPAGRRSWTAWPRPSTSSGSRVRHPGELLDPALNSEDAVCDHLLAPYIPAATALRPRADGQDGDPDHVRAWLTTLAAYLAHNEATGRTLGGRPLPTTDIVRSLGPAGSRGGYAYSPPSSSSRSRPGDNRARAPAIRPGLPGVQLDSAIPSGCRVR